MTQPLPFGTWPSPISSEDLATASMHHEDLVSGGDAVWFTRSDPDSGQMRLHRWTADGGVTALAGDLDVRSRIHEYGGGAIAARGDLVVVANFADQRLYRVEPDGNSSAITPDTDARIRIGDGVMVDNQAMVAVRETHADGGVANELVMVDLDSGKQTVLVDDHDFVAAPRLGPDGRVAWLAWDHPDMPWDAAAAWTGRLVDGQLVDMANIAGGEDVAVADLAYDSNGALVHSCDATGFWELYRFADETIVRLTDLDVDLGKPRWQLGRNAIALVGDTIVAVATTQATDELGVVGGDGGWTPLPGPAVAISSVVAHGDGVVAREIDADGRQAIRIHGLDGSATTIDEIAPITTRPGDIAQPVAITVGSGDEVTHAFFHPPANQDVEPPADGAPPLVVFLHGGPTGHTVPARTWPIAFWTTRGFAVVDVNYRGSTGFGRHYRNLMRGRWGEIEVADVIAVAADLADRGWVDGEHMAVRGGSAGGFTTLAVLTQPEHPFACGTSFFGVADLAALAEHTHKFESRYLDRMVGPLPQARDVYDARSPLSHVDNLSVPLLVLQGLDDEVVPPAQSEVIVAAAAQAGIPHAYITFEGEGHGFRKPENIRAWHDAELAFYGEVMGFEPHGDLAPVLDRQSEGA